MPVYKVNINWQKERFKGVECNTDQSPEIFKAMLFSLTGVPPDRQKVMISCKILGNENFDGIKLKDGMTIMLVGTAEELPTHQQVDVPISEDRVVIADEPLKVPIGMINLGNTCYMNATVQLLYSIPELRAALDVYQPSLIELQSGLSLVQGLQQLFTSLSKEKQAVIPAVFVTRLRTAYPQFATTASAEGKKDLPAELNAVFGAHFLQQDANECWVELVRTLQGVTINPEVHRNLPEILRDPNSTTKWNFVDRYFTGHLTCTLTCTEAEEEPTVTTESFTQLSCFINQDVKFLHTGIRNGFEGTLTKHSPTLGRNVSYKKSSVITRLPAYLCIHFVRFFYKEDKKINAKILKDVKFPMELDLYSFCSESLQKQLLPTREKMKQQEDRAVHSTAKLDRAAGRTGKDIKPPNPLKNPELFAPYSLASDPGSNNSGFYELKGVLSHQGRTSSSGHYVAWVKVENDWVKFDDDTVTFVTADDILRLSGGGDWHCAYVLLYGPKRVLKDDADPTSLTASTAVEQKTEASIDPLSGDRRME